MRESDIARGLAGVPMDVWIGTLAIHRARLAQVGTLAALAPLRVLHLAIEEVLSVLGAVDPDDRVFDGPDTCVSFSPSTTRNKQVPLCSITMASEGCTFPFTCKRKLSWLFGSGL